MTMYERIKDLCKMKGITVAQLETLAGLKPRTMTRWDENAPSWKKVAQVAEILGTTMDYLAIGEKENPAPKNGAEYDQNMEKAVSILRGKPQIRKIVLVLDKMEAEELFDIMTLMLDVVLDKDL